MTKEFKKKLRTWGPINTKKYKYIVKDNGDIYRIKLEYLNTTAVYTEWEKVGELE